MGAGGWRSRFRRFPASGGARTNPTSARCGVPGCFAGEARVRSAAMAYQSLYRKYRPQRFAELVGQEHVTTALRNAVRDRLIRALSGSLKVIT